MVLVQATKPGPPLPGAATDEVIVGSGTGWIVADGLQEVTVVNPFVVDRGVGQIWRISAVTCLGN
jgi:hypothetical protein